MKTEELEFKTSDYWTVIPTALPESWKENVITLIFSFFHSCAQLFKIKLSMCETYLKPLNKFDNYIC